MDKSSSSYSFYSPTKILSGNKALENLPVELAGMDAGRPLVLAAATPSALRMEKVMAAAFADSGLELGIYSGIAPVPDRKLVRDLYRLFRDQGYDSLIALGGGPVLDVAKALNVAVSGKPEDLGDIAAGGAAMKKLRPLTAVTGLDVSGYEFTRYAVLDSLLLSSPAVIPDLLVVDPRTAPAEDRQTTAAAALLTLTQAVESFFHPGRNHLTAAYAYGASRFVMDNLAASLKNPADRKRRVALANAAFFAQTAFDNLAGGMTFALATAMSRRCAVKPGLLMGLLLPHGLLLEMNRESPAGRDLLLAVGGPEAYAGTAAEMGLRKAVDRVVELLLEIQSLTPGFPRSIRDVGLTRSDLDDLPAAAPAVPGTGAWSAEDLRYLLDKAWETRF